MNDVTATRVADLLTKWEQVYKKGLLSFWILLFLHDRPAYAYELKGAITELSMGSLSAEDNSIYRALNRFESMGIVDSELKESSTGPHRRYYRLTAIGNDLLAQFIRRNILIFESHDVAARIHTVVNEPV